MTALSTERLEEREQQARAVIDLVAAGELLNDACKKHDITPQSFGRVLGRLRSLADLYAQAQYIAADLMIDDTIRIADNPKVDPAQARNMMQVRQWAASKRAPKTYGERLDIAVTQSISVSDALIEARARMLRPVSDQPLSIEAQDVDFTEVAAHQPRDEASRDDEQPDIFS